MAAPTEKQIQDLEKAMTEQFYYLVQGAAFRIALARKYGLDGSAFIKYNNVFVPLVRKWVLREIKYERELLKKNIIGIIGSGDLQTTDFYYSASLPKLTALVKKWNVEKTSGIGFIPLLIWAAIALIGAFTAVMITDDLTTTTQEKEELLRTTQQTAKDLGLTPEQAAGLISQTQAEASGGGIEQTIKWLAVLAAGVFIVPQLLKTTNK